MSRRGLDEPGLIDAIGRLAGTILRTVQSRLELASIELGDARRRLVSTLIATLLVAFLLGGAIAAFSAWIAASLWDRLGPAVLGWMALAYAAAGIGLLLWLRHRIQVEPALMADTLAELRHDATLLRGGDVGSNRTPL